MSKKLVGRQPIVDLNLRTYGYELLFRDSKENVYPQGFDGNRATYSVIGSILFLGLENIVGPNRAFVNFPEDLILSEDYALLPSRQVVIEVLETVKPTRDVMESCKKIRSKGYSIALDDYTPDTKTPLVDVADMVKVDIIKSGIGPHLKELVRKLLEKGKTPLAEKVESVGEFRTLREMGFCLFQGYFFSKPQIVEEKDIPPNKLSLMRIMGEASQRPGIKELERIISSDPALSFKLLRYINSAMFNPRSPFSSIHRAVVYLGKDEVSKWLMLVALSEVGTEKPQELITSSLLRANMAEDVVAAAEDEDLSMKAYTTGILSLMDAILDKSMEEILSLLPLDEEIKSALLEKKGYLGSLIEAIKLYEKQRFEELPPFLEKLGITLENMEDSYTRALEKTTQILRNA